MKSSYIVNEGISSQELADVLFRRLEARYPDIVTNHGHEVVGDAVQNVANFHAGAGTGDIGIMLRQILKQLEDSAHPANEAIDLEEDAGQPRVRKYTKERPDGTMMVRYEVLDHKGYRIPGQGPEGFDDLSTAKKFLRDKSFDLMAQRESKSAILSGVLLSK